MASVRRIILLGIVLPLLLGCTSREQILRVYNWADYIDPTLTEEFEQWYEEQTGEPVKVVYKTYDLNERMLGKIEMRHRDFDVVCPSDYIIERMLREGLLLPIPKDFGDTPNYIDVNLSPYIRDCFRKFRTNGLDANDYAVGYMWGTTGILYNAKYVTDEEASSWEILRNPKFADKIFIKDSARDVFSQIILFLHYDDIREGKVTMDELMLDSSDEALAEVEAFLDQVKPLVAGWEADFGKDQMLEERGWISLNWSGEGVWTPEQAERMGIDIRFVNPREGFTVWFDGWVIPKYAKNIKAASYWINFMSRPDNVIRNVAQTGYVSASGSHEVLDAFVDESFDPLDLSYFFGPKATAVRTNPALYPDRTTMANSTMEHDWGEDRTLALLAMWSRVKGEGTNTVMLIVFGLIAAGLLAVGFYRRLREWKKESEEER